MRVEQCASTDPTHVHDHWAINVLLDEIDRLRAENEQLRETIGAAADAAASQAAYEGWLSGTDGMDRG